MPWYTSHKVSRARFHLIENNVLGVCLSILLFIGTEFDKILIRLLQSRLPYHAGDYLLPCKPT